MERLTEKTIGCFEYRLKEHKPVIGEFGTYEAFYDYLMAVRALGKYEDAEEQGLLLRLPDIKHYKTLYWIWGNEIMPVKYMGISHGCVDKHKKFHVVCRVHTKKDRTFTSGKKVITYKAGDKRFFYHDDIGKTIFLTMEAAEAALKGSTSEIRGNHNVDMDNPLTASIIKGKEALKGNRSLDSK